MYLIICFYNRTPIDYIGPFNDKSRANEFATLWRTSHTRTINRHRIVKMIVPGYEQSMADLAAKSNERAMPCSTSF